MMEKMLISVNTGMTYNFDKPEESMRLLKECGFEAVDYSLSYILNPGAYVKGNIYPLAELSVDELKEHLLRVKRAADDNGIVFSQMHAPFPLHIGGHMDKFEAMFEITCKIILACGVVGCPYIVFHPYVSGSGDKAREREINMDMFTRLIPYAEEAGVVICIENVPRWRDGFTMNGCCTEAKEACEYIDELNAIAGKELFGACFDTGHANCTASDIKREILTLGKRLKVLHIHENDTVDDLHMIPYTSKKNSGGTFDWECFIEGLREIEYEGNLSFECGNGQLVLLPPPCRADAMKLISSIGRYFRSRITEEIAE